ncbi:SPOR domain-containing protein [Puniceibacterium sp. IMCC21224]|uniref:SPOR domain-containing protein n=1 Tax=Puniceibacterium sp. IMCC21224 TaxID=1618204 RepID=UPI00064D8A12|nr:SPOR domain-containing protein [Puniceibacterium sp. IMCC21224]KMK67393.1 sporulation related protein [Puniceibacterium sp. IMCC21224]
MAATHYEAPVSGGQPIRNMATVTNWAGAAVSLALIAGVGIWGYKLLIRDVSGIPVVQAAEGPMRIAPEDPGGTSADHQGLAVNAIAGFGTAAAPPDRVTLAPRALDLADEDIASDAVRAGESQRPRTGSDNTLSLASVSSDDTTPKPDTNAIPRVTTRTELTQESIQALADQIAAGIDPLSDAGLADTPPVTTALNAVADEAFGEDEPASFAENADEGELAVRLHTPGVARSLRPQVRPTGLRQTATLAPLAPSAVATTPELDPATLPAGTRVVQLGAYDSPETARIEWDRLDKRFGDYMDGKSRVIERASSGGRTFYRLRAHGFEDISDARRFCAAFVAEKADCIPVVTR